MLAAGLDGLAEVEGDGVLRLKVQGVGYVLGGVVEVVGLEVEAGEDDEGGEGGAAVDGSLGFDARGGRVAALLADLGEAGVGGGGGGVGGDGGGELLLGLGEQALGEVVAA